MILAPDAADSVIWKRIKNPEIDQEEIEGIYCDNKAIAAATESGVVKVTGPTKRTFFSAEEQQKLGIGLSKCPKNPQNLKDALINYDVNLVSADQVACMLMIWPKESNLEDLEKEELDEGEVWEKGEAYMMHLC